VVAVEALVGAARLSRLHAPSRFTCSPSIKKRSPAASPHPAPTAGISRSIGPGGAPLLEGSVARFICTPYAQHETGDHVVFILRVDCWEMAGGPALLFHAGKFCKTERST
jgi:flavin reductase (DIM6/NTAB) family NADH-FMN oxidoreductase RutF